MTDPAPGMIPAVAVRRLERTIAGAPSVKGCRCAAQYRWLAPVQDINRSPSACPAPDGSLRAAAGGEAIPSPHRVIARPAQPVEAI
ncbi:MAG: hypothetical protein ACP5MJ_21780, partial [Roseiflexus sp.]